MPAERTSTPLIGRFTSGQWLTTGSGVLALIALAAIVLSLAALERQQDRRDLVIDRLDPATAAAQRLAISLLNEETGVRGYLLSGDEVFLVPYRQGRAESAATLRRLRALAADDVPSLTRDLASAQAAVTRWRETYADPAIRAVRARGVGASDQRIDTQGKARFDEIRRTLARVQRDIAVTRADARKDLAASTRVTQRSLIFTGVVLLATTLVLWLLLRRAVGAPLTRLAADVRRVSRGEFDLELTPDGARDVRGVTDDVERMRAQIVQELQALEEARAQVEAQAADLQRSNQELEQFAYVASHDLQEPLRKISSFCTLLERRYAGQLDERADQYIAFAVDGAKRMQALINDLLAFSRVGRVGATGFHEVDLAAAAEQARSNVQGAAEETGATITVADGLPTVRGDEALLVAVFQNLISNAMKFHGDDPPQIDISAARDGDDWVLTVRDNGIGIDPEFADRIFVIFQRLHQKETYPGTGIGLAMCRKIVEYHGGRIWLATDGGPGSTFRFTLPAAERPAHDQS